MNELVGGDRDPRSNHAAAIKALEENFWSMWSNFGKGPGCSLHERWDALWFDTPISTLPYNTVLRFSGNHNMEYRISSIVSHYAHRNVPFTWVVHPTAPKGLTAELERHDMKEIDIVDGMIMDLTEFPDVPPVPEGFEVREVLTGEDVQKALDMVAWRWKVEEDAVMHLYAIGEQFRVGLDDAVVRLWAAYKDGEMVSKTVLHCAAGVAGVYGVATRPEVRGNGLAGHLVLKSLQEAREEGYTTSVLHSSEIAVNLYRRMGFRSVCPFLVYATGDLDI